LATALTALCHPSKTAALVLVALLGSTSAPGIAQTLPDASASAESTTDTAATIEDANTRASAFLTADDPVQAQAVLQPLYDRGDYDSQTLFLLALAYKAQGDWPAAKRYLEELLAREPAAAGRVKLELAEVLFRNDEPIRARQLLLEVKASNPPQRVGENIDAFLAFIQSGTPSLFSGWGSIGRLYDTNANQGPNLNTVLIYNLPFTLDKDARGNADWGTVIRAGGSLHYAVNDRFALQAGASVYSVTYDRLSRFDVISASAHAGPSFKRNGWSFSLPYVVNGVKIGHDADWYQISNGFAPQVGWQISPRVSLQASLAWQDKHYRRNRQRHGKALTFSPSLRVGIDASSYASLSGYAGKEGSGVKTYRNASHGVTLGYYKAFNQAWSFYAAPSWSQTRYEGIEAAYGKKRREEFTTNLNYLYAPWGVNVTLSYTYTDNRSSLALYRYRREQTMLSVNKEF